MLTIKHIARELDLDPYKLRQHFRDAALQPQHNGRWKWPDANDPHYQQAMTVAKAYASKIARPSSSKQPASTVAKVASSATPTPTPRARSSVRISGASLKKQTPPS